MSEAVIEGGSVQAKQVLGSLLQSRTETLSRYKDVMSYYPFEKSDTLQEVLEDFCESMVDYTAKMHFSLSGYFEESKEDPQGKLKITSTIYPSLVDNTQSILDFHDQYSSDSSQFNCEKLEHCLSQVGELLADRISLEDRIIEAIMSSVNAR